MSEEPYRAERLILPFDVCHAPCGWSCDGAHDGCLEPCPAVLAHEAGHLGDRAWLAVRGEPIRSDTM